MPGAGSSSQRNLDMYFVATILIFAAATFVFILEGQVNHRTSFDECAYIRPVDKSEMGLLWKAYSYIYPWIFRLSFTSLFVYLGTLMLYNSESQAISPNWRAIFLSNFVAIFFSIIHTFIITLDHVLGDTTCGKEGHHNSISGHFAFHLFYLFILPYLYFSVVDYRSISSFWSSKNLPNSDKRPLILLSSFSLYFVLSAITLYNTWAWGYHSPRQIYYGVLAACISSLILIKLLISNEFEFGKMILPNRLSILAALQALGLILVYPTHGKLPFSWFEVFGVFGFCWPLLVACVLNKRINLSSSLGIGFNTNAKSSQIKKQ